MHRVMNIETSTFGEVFLTTTTGLYEWYGARWQELITLTGPEQFGRGHTLMHICRAWEDGGVWHSTTLRTSVAQMLTVMWVAPFDDDIIYINVTGFNRLHPDDSWEFLRTTDGGATWEDAGDGLVKYNIDEFSYSTEGWLWGGTTEASASPRASTSTGSKWTANRTRGRLFSSGRRTATPVGTGPGEPSCERQSGEPVRRSVSF